MNVPHPSTFLKPALRDEIRKYSAEAEQLRDLHPQQLEIIFKEKWLKMFVPKEFGGLGLTLAEVLRIEEALAWADGSTAWVVTLCSGAGWFVGFLDAKLVDEVFHVEHLCLAGSGTVAGTAEIVESGYKINGSWKYASGSLHATLFTANCAITKKGQPVMSDAGQPTVKAFAFQPGEVQVIRSWNSMGMIATASHSFTISDLTVPATRAFQIDARHTQLSSPAYKYPFQQLAETTLTVNLSGMAQQFLDLCESRLLNDRNSKSAREPAILKHAQEQLATARTSFFAAAEASWEHCQNSHSIPASILISVTAASHALAQTSISLVDKLYPYMGLGAADVSTEINRVYRNFHTASQHSLFTRG
jgi:alkylation response protein AidB-like acyl-CoA dehydrogenase